MTFSAFLKENNLPENGEQVINPEDGRVYTVSMYVFDGNDELAIISDSDDYEISFAELRAYRKMSEVEFYDDLFMEQQEQMG